MKYRIRTLRRAQRDVDVILDWIANKRQSPQGAAQWLKAFESAADSLASFPLRCGLARENDIASVELRQILFKTTSGRTYRGIFCIVEDEILILRVRGPGQPDLAFDELPEADDT